MNRNLGIFHFSSGDVRESTGGVIDEHRAGANKSAWNYIDRRDERARACLPYRYECEA